MPRWWTSGESRVKSVDIEVLDFGEDEEGDDDHGAEKVQDRRETGLNE